MCVCAAVCMCAVIMSPSAQEAITHDRHLVLWYSTHGKATSARVSACSIGTSENRGCLPADAASRRRVCGPKQTAVKPVTVCLSASVNSHATHQTAVLLPLASRISAKLPPASLHIVHVIAARVRQHPIPGTPCTSAKLFARAPEAQIGCDPAYHLTSGYESRLE